MLMATDAWADGSCGNPELLGEERFGQQVLGNMTTCGEKTSLVKSVGIPGRLSWPLVSWAKAVGVLRTAGVLCTAGAHDLSSVKPGGTCSLDKNF